MSRTAFLLAFVAGSLPIGRAAAAPAASSSPQVRIDEDGERVPVKDAIPDENVSRILYLNRCTGGCIIKPGEDNARDQTSSIVNGTSSISEFRHSDEVWNQVVQCVKDIYAPYDVEVTDVDPGPDVLHHEAIVAGDYPEIGFETPVGGVAPSICVPRNNVISFTFANGYSADPIRICETVAQESAHSYGLEHAFDCSDPMTYLGPCGRKFFRDKVNQCGEYEPRDCDCGGSAQNSHRWLKTVLGANPDPISGPDVEILEPADSEEVADGFSIAAGATDLRGIGHVDLYINGTMYDSVEGHDYTKADTAYWFDAPADLADGILDVEIRAYDDIETESVQTITVTKGDPCSTADDCNEGQECDDGRCVWPPPTGQLGDACDSGKQCESGLCPSSGDESYCSQTCSPGVADSCPGGFKCVETQINQGVCWPGASGGCGCEATGPEGAAGALALLLLALFGLRGVQGASPRRRSRSSASSSGTSRQAS